MCTHSPVCSCVGVYVCCSCSMRMGIRVCEIFIVCAYVCAYVCVFLSNHSCKHVSTFIFVYVGTYRPAYIFLCAIYMGCAASFLGHALRLVSCIRFATCLTTCSAGAACTEEFLRFDLEHSELIILHTVDARQATKEALKDHCIPCDRSADLERKHEKRGAEEQRVLNAAENNNGAALTSSTNS